MGGYFQKGFNLKSSVAPVLTESYHSPLVDRLRALGFEARAGELRFKLAREFGFCYGVDRAVQYAYETRERFPDKRIFLSGEIIHNPDVNRRIQEMVCRPFPHPLPFPVLLEFKLFRKKMTDIVGFDVSIECEPSGLPFVNPQMKPKDILHGICVDLDQDKSAWDDLIPRSRHSVKPGLLHPLYRFP